MYWNTKTAKLHKKPWAKSFPANQELFVTSSLGLFAFSKFSSGNYWRRWHHIHVTTKRRAFTVTYKKHWLRHFAHVRSAKVSITSQLTRFVKKNTLIKASLAKNKMVYANCINYSELQNHSANYLITICQISHRTTLSSLSYDSATDFSSVCQKTGISVIDALRQKCIRVRG